MNIKEIRINIPEGMEIDKENSTFEYIKFKPISKWRDNESAEVSGYWIDCNSSIVSVKMIPNIDQNHSIFATEKQAKSALAMAQLSQIIANDKRFGGPITDKEWKDGTIRKHTIEKYSNEVTAATSRCSYRFLAFHIKEQRDLFLEENKDLVKDYLMID